MNRLFVSVDMDEWYFSRWATGSAYSRWPNVESCFREIYKSDSPKQDLQRPADIILQLFSDLGFKSTFFFTGYVGKLYPSMVKQIANLGHEIGCHNMYHLDYEYESREKFKTDLTDSKKLLEDTSGSEIVGYRSPNSSIPATIVKDLEDAGFKYDSSVTPTRKFMGKFGHFSKAPRNPYTPAYNNVAKEGDSKIMEFPWAIFPLFSLPAGSGIMHRIMGNLYNDIAVDTSLKLGHTSYYFHPYEIVITDDYNHIKLPVKAKILHRNFGEKYFKDLKKFLFKHQQHLINGKSLLSFRNAGNIR